MTKILVADDNSNVHKTVALALGELGVDVLAVNNGEAAVRKIPELLPDLVLADIFMPVRNGYEVCDFVKKDIRLQHIPVVLLVGAFDPLDEREAQRVGADGILKKPFVPPEPLITMVRTLLERAATQRPVEVAVSRPPVSKAAVPVSVQSRLTGEAPHDSPATHEETPLEELSVPPAPVTFGEGDRPIAFGSLLGSSDNDAGHSHTRVIEPVDNDQVLTSQRDASLGEPIFWRNEPPPAETEAEAGAANPAEHEFSSWASQAPVVDQPVGSAPPESEQPLELVLEEPDAILPSQVDSAAVSIDPAANTALTIDTSSDSDLILSTQEWLNAAPPPPPANAASDVPNASEPPVIQSPPPFPSTVPERATSKAAPNARGSHSAMEKIAPPPAPPPAINDQPVPPSQWADLAAKFEVGTGERRPVPVAPVPPPPSLPQPPTSKTAPATTQAAPPPHAASSPAPAEPSATDPAVIEAVVERVLDKMRPQVVDIITKEFLRPVVQALVTREIEKK